MPHFEQVSGTLGKKCCALSKMANYYFNEALGFVSPERHSQSPEVKVNSGNVAHVKQLHVCHCTETISMDVKAQNDDGMETTNLNINWEIKTWQPCSVSHRHAHTCTHRACWCVLCFGNWKPAIGYWRVQIADCGCLADYSFLFSSRNVCSLLSPLFLKCIFKSVSLNSRQ